MIMKKNKYKKKKNFFSKRKKFFEAIACVHSTRNNTIITITKFKQGNVLGWSSSGSVGFKGAHKETPLGAKKAAEVMAQFCLNKGIKKLHIRIKGTGFGKDAALKGLRNSGIKFQSISDFTSYSYNGCRPPKKRRL